MNKLYFVIPVSFLLISCTEINPWKQVWTELIKSANQLSITGSGKQEVISSQEQFLTDLQEAEKQNPDKKKKYAFAIEELWDGTYNYYPATYEYSNSGKIREAFINKGLIYSTWTVNIKEINFRKILEINAMEHSNNPKKMREFLSLVSPNVKQERDSNLKTIYKYSFTKEQAETYKSEIQELQEYSGFSGVILP
jgi:hypothetical protein